MSLDTDDDGGINHAEEWIREHFESDLTNPLRLSDEGLRNANSGNTSHIFQRVSPQTTIVEEASKPQKAETKSKTKDLLNSAIKIGISFGLAALILNSCNKDSKKMDAYNIQEPRNLSTIQNFDNFTLSSEDRDKIEGAVAEVLDSFEKSQENI